MKKVTLDKIKYGDFLEQNLYRFDSLLALPRGASMREIEIQNIKDLKPRTIATSPYHSREYSDLETLSIIKEVIEHCTLWDELIGNKLYDGLEKKLRKHKKVLSVLTLMRETDHYTFTNSVNIALVSAQLMMVNEKVDKDLIDIAFYALIHDIGKIKVAKFTQKVGELTEMEFKKIQEHPMYSYELLLKYGISHKDAQFSLQTHERYDGSGYPMNLRDLEIQPLAQLVAVAETYNALASYRPHRKPFHPIEITNLISEQSEQAFSSSFVDLFVNRFNPYQENSLVILEDGRKGIILKVNKQVPLFPQVGVFKDGTELVVDKYNLYRKKDIRILKVFKPSKGGGL